MVAEARQRVRELTPAEVVAARDRGVLLVDIQEPDEREATGFIPGAVFAPRGMLEFWPDPTYPAHREEFDPSAPVVLYCASGGRSALAAAVLADLGYRDVSHLEGGINCWLDDGFALEHERGG